MDYGNIIKRGWAIAWKNKYLWILGFLAALGGNGSSGSFNFNTGGDFGGPSGGSSGGTDFPDLSDLNPSEILSEMSAVLGLSQDVLTGIAGTVIFVVCCLLLIRLVMWFVRFIAEAGLIQTASDIEDGLAVKRSFSEAFAAGRPYLGRLLVARIALLLPIIILSVLSIVAGLALIGTNFEPANFESVAPAIIGIFFCLFCLVLPYSLWVTFVYPLAQRGIVLRELGSMDGIRHGWRVLRGNPGELILLAIIFGFIGFGFGIATAIVVVPIVLATLGPAIYSLVVNNTVGTGLIVLAGLGIILSMVVGSLISSVLITFRSSTFTLAYRELTGKEKMPELAG